MGDICSQGATATNPKGVPRSPGSWFPQLSSEHQAGTGDKAAHPCVPGTVEQRKAGRDVTLHKQCS